MKKFHDTESCDLGEKSTHRLKRKREFILHVQCDIITGTRNKNLRLV